MKKLVAILLSGSLVCAVSLLGETGTAAGNTTGSGMPNDIPTVTGELLNPAFFAHGAYVMQGVSDPAKAFAVPLLGVPELNFFPTASGIDPSTVTWSLEVGDPKGIDAEIRSNILYIWGNSATWSGYGRVTLTATAGGTSGSVTIPVTVFRTDRTLVNAQGKKDYFVPWSPQLDINRVISVEEHMRKYNKDEGALDRTVQWSRYRALAFMRSVNAGGRWLNSHSLQGWSTALQYRMVDVAFDELRRLHIDWIKIDPFFYMWTLDSNEVVRVYDNPMLGPSWTNADIRYVIDEAHRRGIRVMGSLQLWPLRDGAFYGPGRQEMRPSSWSAWVGSYSGVVQELATIWQTAGADAACPGVELFNLSKELTGIRYITDAEWNASMVHVVGDVRSVYDGPVTWAPAVLPMILHDDAAYERELTLFRELDILGFNAYFYPLATGANPSLNVVVQGWQGWEARVIRPIVDQLQKPYVFTEIGGESKDGLLRNGPMQASTKPVDLQEQVLLYQAIVAAFFSEPGFFGAYWWEYSLNAAAPTDSIGGYDDGECTFRLKPAEQVVELAYAGHVTEPAASLDGQATEWTADRRLAQDPTGDSLEPGADLLGLYVAHDHWYQYVAVQLRGGLGDNIYLHLYLDADGDGSPETPVSIDRRGSFGALRSSTSWADLTGFVDVAASPDRSWFEIRISRTLVAQDASQDLRAEIWSARLNAVADAITSEATPAMILTENGRYTNASDEVIAGRRSILGSYSGIGGYAPYLRTDPSVLQLIGGHTYRVSFDYRILVANAKGFETLFYSPMGGSEGKWLESKTVYGAASSSGSATLTATLLDYPDYEVRWNIVAIGAIVIDNIVLTDLTAGQVVATEDAEE
jgi:hypothetical protein